MCSMEHCNHNICRQASVSANPRVPAAVSQGAALAVCPPCPAQRPEQRCASRASARTDVVQLSDRSAVGAFRLTCMPCVSSHIQFFFHRPSIAAIAYSLLTKHTCSFYMCCHIVTIAYHVFPTSSENMFCFNNLMFLSMPMPHAWTATSGSFEPQMPHFRRRLSK